MTDKTEKKRLKVKLSYKEERELERLPEEIEELEGTQSSLHETLNAPRPIKILQLTLLHFKLILMRWKSV